MQKEEPEPRNYDSTQNFADAFRSIWTGIKTTTIYATISLGLLAGGGYIGNKIINHYSDKITQEIKAETESLDSSRQNIYRLQDSLESQENKNKKLLEQSSSNLQGLELLVKDLNNKLGHTNDLIANNSEKN